MQTLRIQSLRYSPFYVTEAEITAAQYCRFMNTWAGRFANKTALACTVTSVMNTAQGGVLVEVHVLGDWNVSAVRATPNTADDDAYSKIMWDGAAYVLNSGGSETNEAMTEVSWVRRGGVLPMTERE